MRLTFPIRAAASRAIRVLFRNGRGLGGGKRGQRRLFGEASLDLPRSMALTVSLGWLKRQRKRGLGPREEGREGCTGCAG